MVQAKQCERGISPDYRISCSEESPNRRVVKSASLGQRTGGGLHHRHWSLLPPSLWRCVAQQHQVASGTESNFSTSPCRPELDRRLEDQDYMIETAAKLLGQASPKALEPRAFASLDRCFAAFSGL